MINAIKSLFQSRKFLLALFALITSIVAHYADIPTEIWVAFDAVIMVLINAIAKEDAAEKSNPNNNQYKHSSNYTSTNKFT